MEPETEKTISWFTHCCLAGLPRWFGGKRKMANVIIGQARGKIFVDAFMGAGSISLLAKAENYEVRANDYSLISSFIGKGYLENDRITLDEFDIKRLFVKAKNNKHYCQKHYSPGLFTTRHSEFIDNVASILNVDKQIKCETKLALYNCFLMKFIFALRPYGNFSTKFLSEFFEHPFDTENYPEYSNTSCVRDVFLPVYDLAMKIKNQVNNSVFINGKENKFYSFDIFDFLSSSYSDGDTIYFDPPYYGSSAYENYYASLVSILLQKKIKIDSKNPFNSPNWEKHFNQMLELSKKIPRWIISYGCQKVEPEYLLEVVKKYRKKATLYKIPYVYSVGTIFKEYKKTLPVATEILVVADA